MARRLLYSMPGMQTGTTGNFAKHQRPTVWGGPCAVCIRAPARAAAQIAPSRWPKARTPRCCRNCHETFLCPVRPGADFPAVAAAPSIFQKPAEPPRDCPSGAAGVFYRFPANGGLDPACGGLGNPPHATFSGFPRGHASPRRPLRGGVEAPGVRPPQNPRPRICRNCHETFLGRIAARLDSSRMVTGSSSTTKASLSRHMPSCSRRPGSRRVHISIFAFSSNGGLKTACGGLGNPPHASFFQGNCIPPSVTPPAEGMQSSPTPPTPSFNLNHRPLLGLSPQTLRNLSILLAPIS